MPSKYAFEVGERIIYDTVCHNYPPHTGEGEIIGIYTEFPMMTFYIVLLDEPVLLEGKDVPWRGFVVPNSCLTRVISTSTFPLDNEE